MTNKMSRDAPLQGGSLCEKVFQLEDQVKGLMEAVNALLEASHLDNGPKIPKPDQYVRDGGYTMGEMYDRLPAMDKRVAAAAAHAAPRTAPKAETKPAIAISDIHSLPAYKYSPLSAGSSEIRLLALQRSTSPTEATICRLFKVNLDDAPKFASSINPLPISVYTPLSYCWGTTSGKKRIVIDGQSFHVTPSLYSALQHFRGVDRDLSQTAKRQESNNETYWWIDAICVNQEDLDERSSQVRLMTRLYKQAQLVHVWLGPESEDSSRGMQLIRDLAYLPKTEEETGNWTYIPKPGQTHRPDGPGRPMVKLPSEPAPIPVEEKLKNYKALVNIYQRPWFSRVWIRQEVALPGDVKFHCGTETCSWEDVMRTADILAFLADGYHLPALQGDIRQDGLLASCFQKAGVLKSIRRNTVRSTSYLKLDWLVLGSRDAKATDPRDKVFAMLPLTNPDETDIVADYRKGHLEVYKATALSLIKTDIDYLAGCQLTSRSDGLPSWVPNLELPWNPRKATGADHRTDMENFPGINASSSKFTYYPKHSRLDVQGVIFDIIGTINHEYYITPTSLNGDALAVGLQWKEFYTSEIEKLYTSWENEDRIGYYEKREQCTRMFQSPDILGSWEHHVLRNSNSDTYEYQEVLYLEQKGENNLDHEPVLKQVQRLLPSEPSPFSKLLHKDNYLDNLRKLAVGRRCITTLKGGLALAPSAAKVGDRFCFFDGSKIPFIIRPAGDDTWVIVGEACKFLPSLHGVL
jgi:hypothetical protein